MRNHFQGALLVLWGVGMDNNTLPRQGAFPDLKHMLASCIWLLCFQLTVGAGMQPICNGVMVHGTYHPRAWLNWKQKHEGNHAVVTWAVVM